METQQTITELRRLEEKHKNDDVPTFSTNWSLLCHDVANRLEELEKRPKDIFNQMKTVCKNSHFTFDRDSHCSGYNYCMLKGFDCVCSFENCSLIKSN